MAGTYRRSLAVREKVAVDSLQKGEPPLRRQRRHTPQIPIIFTWNGAEIVMCTPKNASKLQALNENPMVA